MKVTILDVPQRSIEWHAARLGRLTSSVATDMLATRKDKTEAAGRRNLRVRLALERITGKSCESSWKSPEMEQGSAREFDAASIYEAISGRILRHVGFVLVDELMAGYSPDGIVGDFEGVVEIKSPIPATHYDYLQSNEIPLDYRRQIAHALWVSGAAWCDFLSWCPEFPDGLQTKLIRVPRVQEEIDAYEFAARIFLNSVTDEVTNIQKLAALVAA